MIKKETLFDVIVERYLTMCYSKPLCGGLKHEYSSY